jgi:uncharacterized protein (DUF4415 family)
MRVSTARSSHRSRRQQIALRVDVDVLEWFKAQGEGYQTRMNAVLREFRDAHLAGQSHAG